MFDPEVPYESMNFIEQWLFDIVQKLVDWMEINLTSTAISEGLTSFLESLKTTFGERTVAYAFVDLLDFIADLIKMFS